MTPLRMLTLVLALILPTSLLAGQACEDRAPTPSDVRSSFELALATREDLDASSAEVVILTRAGQDLSRWGLSWSHSGIAWRDHPSGRWNVTHLLNRCGTAESSLFVQGLANFFSDDPVRWEALAIVPPGDIQAKIAAALAGSLPLALHQPSYNMVAYPFSVRYQNSNQWVIELLALAVSGQPFSTRAEAQAWLHANGFRPTTLNLPTMTRLGARLFRANVAFDDHPPEQRWAGRIDTVSVESVARFLTARGAKQFRISHQPGRTPRPAAPSGSTLQRT